MAIYHGSLVDVGARVDEHRRHANHAGCDVGAVTNARSAWHDAHTIFGGKLSDWISVLVEKLQARARWSHLDNRSHAEAEQDATLDPGIRLPLAVCIALGGTNLTTIE